LRRSRETAEQGDEADEAGASDGVSQLVPGVLRTKLERGGDGGRDQGSGMNEEAERSVANRLAALFLTPVIGGVAGALLGNAVAPDSVPSRAITTFMLPFSLFAGLGVWLSAALVLGIGRLLIGRRAERSVRNSRTTEVPFSPPGSIMVLVTAVGFSLCAACFVSALSSKARLLPTLIAYGAMGLGYGVVAWQLARRGYLRPGRGENV
jgi:hypothetical protein